jgi:uncharacterized protein (DUF488 family)
LQRLKKANEQKINVCIMCSETNPKECHRSKVIGVELENMGIGIRHIISKDKEKSQKQVILEATKGLGVNTLFGEETLLSKKKHL